MSCLVSVIIPTYNRANLVCEAIESVLNQTYKNLEIIVVDDGSTDNTNEVLQKYNNQIIYIYQKNRGLPSARNAGIRIAKGKYLAFLDSDDLWLTNKLSIQMEYLEVNREICLLYSDAYRAIKNEILRKTLFDLTKPVSTSSSDFVLDYLFLNKPIHPSTVILNKQHFERVGLFDESLRISEDYDAWLRVAKYYPVSFVNKPLAKIKVDGEKICKKMEDVYIAAVEGRKKMLRVYPNFVNGVTSNKFFASAHYKLGCVQVDNDKIKQARVNFLKSIKYFPWNIKKYFCLFVTFLPNFLLKKYKKIILNLFYGRD